MNSEDSFGFLPQRGEMAARVRAHDWEGTPLGSPQSWPQSLRNAASLMLGGCASLGMGGTKLPTPTAIAQLTDLLQYLETRQNDPEVAQHGARVRAYRDRYGV